MGIATKREKEKKKKERMNSFWTWAENDNRATSSDDLLFINVHNMYNRLMIAIKVLIEIGERERERERKERHSSHFKFWVSQTNGWRK